MISARSRPGGGMGGMPPGMGGGGHMHEGE
jgi:hypothetical protein